MSQFLSSEAGKASLIFEDLQSSLSTQQDEMTVYARELRQVYALTLALFFSYHVILSALIFHFT